MTFRFTFLPLQAAGHHPPANEERRTTHPRSALDENSLVRRRLHSALRPLVDSEGEEELERRGEAATSIRRRESGKNSDYLQTTPSFLLQLDLLSTHFISFHRVVDSI